MTSIYNIFCKDGALKPNPYFVNCQGSILAQDIVMVLRYINNIYTECVEKNNPEYYLNTNLCDVASASYISIVKMAEKSSSYMRENANKNGVQIDRNAREICMVELYNKAMEKSEVPSLFYCTKKENLKNRCKSFYELLKIALVNLGIALQKFHTHIEAHLMSVKTFMHYFFEFIGLFKMRKDTNLLFSKMVKFFKSYRSQNNQNNEFRNAKSVYNQILKMARENASSDPILNVKLKFGMLHGIKGEEAQFDYNVEFVYKKIRKNARNRPQVVIERKNRTRKIDYISLDCSKIPIEEIKSNQIESTRFMIFPYYKRRERYSLYLLYLLIKHRKWFLLEKVAEKVIQKHNKKRSQKTSCKTTFMPVNFCPKISMKALNSTGYSNYKRLV